AKQIHHIGLPFPFLITKAACCITMKNQFLTEITVGAQIKPKSQTFDCICCHPVLPRTDQELAHTHVTCSNEIDPSCISNKCRYFEQRVDHVVNALLCFRKFFVSGG